MRSGSWAPHRMPGPSSWIPILMLHEVVPDKACSVPPYAVTQSRLREILTDFTSRGYTSGSLEAAVRPIAGKNGRQGTYDVPSVRRRQVVLTFDDGTYDFMAYALPILQEFDFRATLFVVAGMVGGMRTWSSLPGQPTLPTVPLMGVQELRALGDLGFTVGSHTVSHTVLPTLNSVEARREIAGSRHALMNLIGRPVDWFAYPYLAANRTTRGLVREAGYHGACGGANQRHSRLYLNRIDASYYTVKELRLRCAWWFHSLRQAVRHVRYRSERQQSPGFQAAQLSDRQRSV